LLLVLIGVYKNQKFYYIRLTRWLGAHFCGFVPYSRSNTSTALLNILGQTFGLVASIPKKLGHINPKFTYS